MSCPDQIPSFEHDSDKDITAETVADTVMAEQMSHDVVDKSQSTSGSPLVDVAVNQTHNSSAGNGINDSLETKADQTQPILSVQRPVGKDDETSSKTLAGIDAAKAAVEPSAGDAVAAAAEILTKYPVASSDATQGLLANGTTDAVAHTDVAMEDGRTPEGSVDVSLNSDTEGSKGDVSEQKKDDKYHVRTSSMKKPATFSKVSVTKNFMAKTATVAPAAIKSGEKPAPTGTVPVPPTMAKPRLIAKTGTSLRDIQKARLGTELSSGPDANKVWNKNRPTPPPPQKQFTDEELKQQYGIHLATRLQTDENDKESKWADIDDDEEDWAPEAVVWMDGTKSTLTPQEVPAVEQKGQAPVTAEAAKVEGAKPVLSILKPTELGPQKTILKPGANAAAAQHAKQNGTVLGSAAEKAALKARSPAPAPVKSPWATLPPVEKMSPINPPVQTAQAPSNPQPRAFASQDARAYESVVPAPPAREIAADTFDRSWREGEGGARELFNSANGLYEPVADGRRGSMRPDRKPALLQRPSHTSLSPGESSQTKGAAQNDGPWARRRGSSLSQGSIPPARRMSVSRPTDLPTTSEQTSSAIAVDDSHATEQERTDPAQPRFAQETSWQQQMPPQTEVGAADQEEMAKAQEKIMREKRELARKRRQEEEARLEEEKQARLKARLAQLEGAGKSRKEREAEAASAVVPAGQDPAASPATAAKGSSATADEAKAAAAAPTMPQAPAGPLSTHPQAQSTQPPQPLPASAKAIEASSQATPLANLTEAVATSAPAAPPLESQPLSQPQPRKPLTEEIASLSSSAKQSAAAVADISQHQAVPHHLSPKADSRTPFQQQSSSSYRTPVTSYSSPGDRKQQPFGRSPLQNTDRFTPWPTTAPSGNVWGNSGIGNGTFESANGFSGLGALSSLPPPPGMGRPATSTRISPQSLGQDARSSSMHQQSGTDASRAFPPPALDSLPEPFATQSRGNGPSPAPGLGRQTHLPGPIAPPSRTQQQPSQPQRPAQGVDPISAWNQASKSLPQQFKMDADAAERKRDEGQRTEAPPGVIKETFRQTAPGNGKLGAPRRFEKTEYTVHDGEGSRAVPSHAPTAPSAQTQPTAPFVTPTPGQHEMWMAANDGRVRMPDSPFNAGPVQPPIAPPMSQTSALPPHLRGISSTPIGPLPPITSSVDDSPPPPETSSHPVNSGTSSHPLVKLPPGTKPKVVVKLPPASTAVHQPPSTYGSMSMPPRPISNRGHPGMSQPLIANETWQARFNGLFGRTPIHTETPPSPPKTPPKMQGPALVVASSSRIVMEEPRGVKSATVSLPYLKRNFSPEGFIIDESSDVMSKPMVDRIMEEERSFGSKPRVIVPRRAAYNRPIGAPYRVNLLQQPLNIRFDNTRVTAQSLPDDAKLDFEVKRTDGVHVNLSSRGLKLHHKLVHFLGVRKGGFDSQRGNRKPSGRYGGNNNHNNNNSHHKGKGRDGNANVAQKAAAAPVSGKTAPAQDASAAATNTGPAAAPAATNSTQTSTARKPSHHSSRRAKSQGRKSTPAPATASS